jgi:hypothetical protein
MENTMKRLLNIFLSALVVASLFAGTCTPAYAFDLSDLAQQFAKDGERPGHQTGPIGGPIQPGYGGQQPAAQPDNVLITELVVMLVGHADYDLSRGAEIYAADLSEKNLNFLSYTVDKVVEALELDREDGTLAPVIEALGTRNPANIKKAISDMHNELTGGLSGELGPEYLWYYEVGQNISRVEFTIWEQSHFNVMGFVGKKARPNVRFNSSPASNADDLARLMEAFDVKQGAECDLVEVFENYMAVRDYIYNYYGFEGSGLILW